MEMTKITSLWVVIFNELGFSYHPLPPNPWPLTDLLLYMSALYWRISSPKNIIDFFILL